LGPARVFRARPLYTNLYNDSRDIENGRSNGRSNENVSEFGSEETHDVGVSDGEANAHTEAGKSLLHVYIHSYDGHASRRPRASSYVSSPSPSPLPPLRSATSPPLPTFASLILA